MTEERPLSGKVAVVTGGSSGIGAASARMLAAAGAKVVVGYNKGADRAAALIDELSGAGHMAMHLPLEDTAQIRKAAAVVQDQFGRADILVNSAGFTRMVPHHDLEALDDDPDRRGANRECARAVCHNSRVCAAASPIGRRRHY
jgi:3-oxoacyl-[acyl-carrier protein] reductase